MDTILGIDLGTTNSVVAVIRDGAVEVLEENGQKMLPSVVGFDAEGQLLVGEAAQNQWALAPDRTVRSIKRKMGSSETVQLGDQSYTPQEVSAMILRTLKDRATRRLGSEVNRAVITVPAYFNEQQREATREAGELAGLDVVRIVNEPTAASLAYESGKTELERLLVYDLGGGTFDVSVVQIEQGVVEVLSSHGDTQLGGDDFDQLLLDHVCDKFKEEHGVELRDSLVSRSRVLRAVEEAKKQLSFAAFATIEEEFLTEKDGIPLHLTSEISRTDYEALIEPLLNKTLVCVDESLSDAKLNASQVDRVILVGGASRTPLVHQMLSVQLGQPIHTEVDPDLCVAMGAALQGGLINGLDLGPVLVDITPHTLGIACLGRLLGVPSRFTFAPIITRNTPLPATRSEVFCTSHDNQEVAAIDVFQGEHDDVRYNDPVGDFQLEGLADANAGNSILVRFDLDLDGILKVTATEKMTGLEETLTIENAMSRFRETEREAAVARIEQAFGASPPREETAAIPDSAGEPSISLELSQAIEQANELLVKTERVVTDANADDAEEIRQLESKLRSAIEAKSLDEIREAIAKLDDLVFYLQDV